MIRGRVSVPTNVLRTDGGSVPPPAFPARRLRRGPVRTPDGVRSALRARTLARVAVLAATATIALSACGSNSATLSPDRTGVPAASATATPVGPASAGTGSPGGAVGAGTGESAPGASAPASAPPLSTPASAPPVSTPASGLGAPAAALASWPFPNGLLIADRGNGRLIVIDGASRIVWQFPAAGSLPNGRRFAADDAFFAPDGKSIVANDESHQTIYRIDIATRKVVWSYGHYGSAGSATGYLNTPDDAYPLANGDVVVADINNCRILEVGPGKSIVHQWGTIGRCANQAPRLYASPNGDTPLPDGGLLITVIHGSRVVRLSADGRVVFDIHVPVDYPSDAQLLPNGNIIVAGYTNPGSVIEVTPRGKLVWRYAPTSGSGRLDHPSLATPLPNGLISVNDDGRQRVVVIDPATMQVVWQYGTTGIAGRGPGHLSDPDGHQPVPANVTF